VPPRCTYADACSTHSYTHTHPTDSHTHPHPTDTRPDAHPSAIASTGAIHSRG